MPEANSGPILSNLPSLYPQISPQPAQEPKIPGHTAVKTTVPHMHVLNRWLAGVLSPVDGL